jgi:putative ABC transport system ATP-binding protein
MNNYFEIENLKCSYNDGTKIVLEIDKLEIPRGKVMFIVGQSGCGKSTILETLGLMNDTLVCESNTKFVFRPDNTSEMDCIRIWNEKNKVLSKIRKDNFSFIFQNTNLMENFSIRENSEISQQIKGGSKKYADVIREVELNQILEEKKENVKELSGGQKQRLAFVRAFLPNFNILFGDEPTGNLDPENADKLIKIIVDEIHNNGIAGQVRNDSAIEKTAIIVSHSPELSTKYADIIVKIHGKKRDSIEETYGKIDADSIYEKKDGKWFFNNTEITDKKLQATIKS